jgi:hypothetical protein
MKLRLVTTICTIASAMMAAAQVPSLINYQGRLTDASGAPVTGSKNFSISIYDAATAGNLLYTESIGAVTLDANGVYSFQFGSAGTSNTQVTETVATTNGTGTTFQKVLENSPVVAGSVSVTDGTYTWSQSAGSSNEDDFGVTYSNNLRRVTVNYYNGAPASGRTITATYRYGTSGITGALSSGAEHWMTVSVDSVVQGTRQRVLAAPFAFHSKTADTATSSPKNLGEYSPRESGVTYQAPTTGFIIGTLAQSDGYSSISIGKTSSSMQLITNQRSYWGNGSQHTVPIQKGYFWRAEGFSALWFIGFE